MLQAEIQILGLQEFIDDAKSVGAVGTDRLVRAALTNSTSRIQANARQLAPHRTGTLQRSILVERPMPYPNAIVSVNEKYGLYIEEGTGPYDIVPKNKKALFWKGAKHPVKKVHHPGIKARPFFWPAVEATQGYIEDQFVKVIEKLTEALAGKVKL